MQGTGGEYREAKGGQQQLSIGGRKKRESDIYMYPSTCTDALFLTAGGRQSTCVRPVPSLVQCNYLCKIAAAPHTVSNKNSGAINRLCLLPGSTAAAAASCALCLFVFFFFLRKFKFGSLHILEDENFATATRDGGNEQTHARTSKHKRRGDAGGR